MAVGAVLSAVRRPRSPRRPIDSTDEQLARRAAEGDAAAFEAIYDRYAPGLLAFCRQLLSNRDEAEDAVQQTLARAYGALRAGRAPSCLKAWLYAIARNRCLTLLTSRRAVVDLDAVRGAVAPADDCYAEVQRRADVGDLVDDLRRLPDDQRSALVLFELGGHSQRDIAAVLGVAPVRVKALVFQAREGLARAREARGAACRDVLEELAVLPGAAPRRGPLADHLARCDACAAFAAEMARQRRALAIVMLPAVPPLALKAKVLGTALTGGGGAAAAVGGTGGAGTIAAAVGGGAGVGGTALVVGGGAARACSEERRRARRASRASAVWRRSGRVASPPGWPRRASSPRSSRWSPWPAAPPRRPSPCPRDPRAGSPRARSPRSWPTTPRRGRPGRPTSSTARRCRRRRPARPTSSRPRLRLPRRLPHRRRRRRRAPRRPRPRRTRPPPHPPPSRPRRPP